MSKPNSEKKKMATVREVYNRIIWDARLNRNAFAIAYIDRTRLNSIREKPLVEWVADGDIPWHRVRYIRCGETIVWDRESHLDLISTGQLPAAAWAVQSQEETPAIVATAPYINVEFKTRSVYQYGSQGWQPTSSHGESTILDTLTIVTFNVLCDMHEANRIQTQKRIPAILKYLRDCNAEIIALQEVTPSLLEALLEQDWVREGFISESPDASTIQPYGIVILSRSPFTLVERQYSAHKRVLVGTWQINSLPLQVAVVHLPSNRAHNAVELRASQLLSLLNYLDRHPGDCLIVGDFNSGAQEQAHNLAKSGFIDIWEELQPTESGDTFDPRQNALAALMSQNGDAGRLDRILLRSYDNHWLPQQTNLFACEPIPDTQATLYASDHFGVRAALKSSVALQTPRPTYRSAIVVMPPVEIWSAIQAIRRRFDRNIDRWMPHINLIYGFIPEDLFEEAAQIIERSLADIQPFEIALTGFQTFEHRASTTAWLQPNTQPPKALHQLQAVLQKLFPQCNEQSAKSAAGFTPHLSVGQFKSAKEAIAQLPPWHPISFLVESVALISRRDDEPFEVRYRVPLGQGRGDKGKNSLVDSSLSNPDLMQLVERLEPALNQAQKEHRETILAVVRQAIAECLGFEPRLQLLGSARLGVESAQSDLDVVCLIPDSLSGKQFLVNVEQTLQGLCDRSRIVETASVPALRMQLEGISVDLLYARIPSAMGNLDPLTHKARNYLDSASWKALVGCLEADAVADAALSRVPRETFQKLLRAVRAWAKVRQIRGNAWGFLGNFSWALLAAWSCANYPQTAEATVEALLAHFFQTLCQHNWNQPIALSEAGKQYRLRTPPDWLAIVTSIEPVYNSARNLSRATAQLLRREFERGAALVEKVKAGELSWQAIFEPADLLGQSPLFLVLTATSQNSDALETCCGWLEGHFIGLVIDLEQRLSARVRPWPEIWRNGNTINVVLGVEMAENSDRALLEQLGKDFAVQFDGSILQSRLSDGRELSHLLPPLQNKLDKTR